MVILKGAVFGDLGFTLGFRRVKLPEEGARVASSGWVHSGGDREREGRKRDCSVLQVAGGSQTEVAGSRSAPRHLGL